MQRIRRRTALERVFITLLALLAAGTASGSELVEAGRILVNANCARCHAIAGPGPSPVAVAPPFSTLARRYPLDNLAEAFAEGITVYHPQVVMPEFVFTPQEIEALLAYLASVQE
jgi:mono/diheme cytochrome c family protein